MSISWRKRDKKDMKCKVYACTVFEEVEGRWTSKGRICFREVYYEINTLVSFWKTLIKTVIPCHTQYPETEQGILGRCQKWERAHGRPPSSCCDPGGMEKHYGNTFASDITEQNVMLLNTLPIQTEMALCQCLDFIFTLNWTVSNAQLAQWPQLHARLCSA